MIKLSVAKYWFSYGYLDGHAGMTEAPPITIPTEYDHFYIRGYSCGKSFKKRHNFTNAAKRVLCS